MLAVATKEMIVAVIVVVFLCESDVATRPKPPDILPLDPESLEQVMRGYISYATKYMA